MRNKQLEFVVLRERYDNSSRNLTLEACALKVSRPGIRHVALNSVGIFFASCTTAVDTMNNLAQRKNCRLSCHLI